jgi:hypothetical protein
LDGIGALSHSSYHYIDVIAWYLSIAKGDIYKISINLPYILRVKDYLEINGYSKLRELIEEDGSEAFNDPNKIPIQVLAAELDFTFHLNLFNKNNQLLGLVTYTSSHTTFTPRLTKYHKDMIEYTNDKLGGRMSQVYFDIHQGAMQNIQIIKNDVVFEENKILTYTRKHPLLGKPLVIKKYRNAYDRGTATPKDLVNAFIKYTNGQDVNHDHLSAIKNFDNQRLTNKLFSLFYELIAQNYQNKGRNKKIKIDNEIILGDYL